MVTNLIVAGMLAGGCFDIPSPDVPALFYKEGERFPEKNLPPSLVTELKEEGSRRIEAYKLHLRRVERAKRYSFNGSYSAYYPYPDALQGGYFTATGFDMRKSLYYEGYRIVAADKSIPFYSILEIEVNGQIIKGIVLDRGGAIKGGKLDIVHPDRESAYSFGKKSGKVRILRYGKDKWVDWSF